MVTATPYHFRIAGQLDPSWEDWFDGITITPLPDGTTLLVGALMDQAAVHGVLNKIRDLGLTLVSVQQQDSRDDSGE
jgi:hypothetical protein